MQYNKSYRLLRFLNREHGGLSRHTLAVLGWLGTLAATRSARLARASWREFVADDYYSAFRKAARFARHLSPRFDLFSDPFYDFTHNTTPPERRALTQALEGARKRLPEALYLTDLLYLQAADIHALLEQGEHSAAEAAIREFHDLANQALARAGRPAPTNRATPTRDAPENTARTPDFSQAQASEALHDIAALLPLDVWPWFVISGTFLGLHREGSFLAHDYDIDLGIHAAEVDLNRLRDILRASENFALKKQDSYLEVIRDPDHRRALKKRPAILKAIHQNGLQLDIFIHYTEDGVCWHGTSIHRWDNTPFHLARRELAGVTVNAPVEADRYLGENYGDWRIPCTAFDCTTGTPNLVVARNFISLALFIKRYVWFAGHSPREARQLENTLIEAGVIARHDGQPTLVARL